MVGSSPMTAMQNTNPPHHMIPFTVIVTRQSAPTDGTNGHHGRSFNTRREALEYAHSEIASGCERAAVIQHTVRGQRRIATLNA